MRNDLSNFGRNDEELRNARMARGLRAVALSLVIGGIVLAALDTTHAPRGEQRDAADAIVDTATGVPLVSPTSRPAGDEPALRQVDHAMEGHG